MTDKPAVKKQTSAEISAIAARTLSRGKPDWMDEAYWTEVVAPLAGSCLSQDETPQPAPHAKVRS